MALVFLPKICNHKGMVDIDQARIAAQRKLKEWWPSIYQVINGFFSYMIRTSKQIALDVLKEISGRG